MQELISVIVPVHNGQDYLEKCIDSIAGQTYRALEIIVVNDGSTDDTARVCGRLTERYGNVSVITLPDIGVAAARNRAIEQAKGDYITFVDADDRLCPDMLARLYEALQSTGSDIAGCRFATWSTDAEWQRIAGRQSVYMQSPCGDAPEGERAKRELTKDETKEETAEHATTENMAQFDSRQYLTDSLLQNNCRCWSKLYRRSVIGQVRFREELTIGEDMLFLVDLLANLHRAVELEYKGYGYYRNPNGLMLRPFKPAYMDQIKCWELAKEEILKRDASLEARVNARLMTAVMLTVGKIALLSGGKRREAKAYLEVCRDKLAQYGGLKESYRYLPEGYRVKCKAFSRCPGGYTALYHWLQRMKR
ncbi:MAG: glycosyltransferase family 2 protein [Lachnospiraceae bacterium]|nr:glycosyltransferase family 2 protein [Lachnospiraceae bacterium]